MSEPLVLVTTAIVLLNLAVALWLTVRRLSTAKQERMLQEAEDELRPVVLAFIDGDDVELPKLDEIEAAAFARLLQRYARLLTGSARARAARAATELVESEVDSLSDRRAWRRAVAAGVVGDLGSRERHGRLLVRLLGDRSPDVRAAAVRAIGRLGVVEAAPRIVRLMALGRIPRALAAEALMTIGSPAADDVERLLAADEAEVRAAAAELLGLVGSPTHGRRLIGLLADPDSEVRVKAARALGRIGAGSAVDALRERLGDPVPYVRAAVARALASLGDRSSVPILREMARHDDFDAARAAAEALIALAPEVVEEEVAEGEEGYLAEALDRRRMG